MTELKDRLKKIRILLDKTQDQMAAIAGVGKATWQNYEYGITPPSAAVLKILTEQFGFNSNWILYEQGGLYVSGLEISESAHLPAGFSRAFLHRTFDAVVRFYVEKGKTLPPEMTQVIFSEVESILTRAQTEREADLLLGAFLERLKTKSF